MKTKLVNMWLVLDQAFGIDLYAYVNEGTPSVTYPSINALTDVGKAAFKNVSTGFDTVWADAGKDYQTQNVMIREDDVDLDAMLVELSNLAIAYPLDYIPVGAWHFEGSEPDSPLGRELGTEWDGGMLTGVPKYPQPVWLLDLMPPIIIGYTDPPDNTDPIYGPATEVTDLLLTFGQAPRTLS